MSSQYQLQGRHKSVPVSSTNQFPHENNSRDTDTGEEPSQPAQLPEVPVINMEDFTKAEDTNNKLDLLMAAINQINTNFHYNFEDLSKKITDEDEALPRIYDLEDNYTDLVERVDKLEETNALLLDELEIVKGLLKVQDRIITSNQAKITDLTSRNMANNILIYQA